MLRGLSRASDPGSVSAWRATRPRKQSDQALTLSFSAFAIVTLTTLSAGFSAAFAGWLPRSDAAFASPAAGATVALALDAAGGHAPKLDGPIGRPAGVADAGPPVTGLPAGEGGV